MKLIIFAIALGFGINTQSQICVDNYLGEYRKVRLSKESIEDVKKRKTYFVVMDFENADQYELAAKQAWTLTPYECISQKEYLKIFDEEKIGNYFSLQGLNYDMLIKKKNNVTNLQETVLTIHNVKSYLRFFTQATKKDWNDIAKVALYPNNAMIQTLMGNKNTAIDSGKSETLIYNLTPIMYKIYLKILND